MLTTLELKLKIGRKEERKREREGGRTEEKKEVDDQPAEAPRHPSRFLYISFVSCNFIEFINPFQ